jgi:hypothetical protein
LGVVLWVGAHDTPPEKTKGARGPRVG